MSSHNLDLFWTDLRGWEQGAGRLLGEEGAQAGEEMGEGEAGTADSYQAGLEDKEDQRLPNLSTCHDIESSFNISG